jgi:hypothetical protein
VTLRVYLPFSQRRRPWSAGSVFSARPLPSLWGAGGCALPSILPVPTHGVRLPTDSTLEAGVENGDGGRERRHTMVKSDFIESGRRLVATRGVDVAAKRRRRGEASTSRPSAERWQGILAAAVPTLHPSLSLCSAPHAGGPLSSWLLYSVLTSVAELCPGAPGESR